ncbi:VanW family protein [Sporosarcina sp. G11-34]|uniref:VanW family protein n=1 Tax=Sporosarcina sp. G11-34 TaxID=2849605 RepID=UPI0022A8E5C4|nr:VanW family protein [Sporosarcina sp. G11-34]MCZ2259818.1 VanW family protein [Sporosarcina sp. G11-34]
MRLKYFFPIFTWTALIVFVLYQAILPSSTALANSDAEVSRIGSMEIISTKKTDLKSQLSTEVTKWKQNDIIVQGTTAKVVIPSDYISFDINKTVDFYIAATSSPWYNFWEGNKNIEIPIEVMVDASVYDLFADAPLFNAEETVAAIKNHAGYLKEGVILAEEVPLTKDLLERISFEIQDVVVDGTGISQIVEELDGVIILNKEQFSFLEVLERVAGYYTDETANFTASTLYSVVLQTELDIQERHSQNVKPKYLEPGIEVKVDPNRSQDFSFSNQTNRPVILGASIKNSRLLIELYSLKSDYEVTYEIRNEEIVEPRTINRLTYDLPIGAVKVEEAGNNGLRVQVYKMINEKNGSFSDEELVSRDFYPPKNKVVLVSSREPAEVIPPKVDDSGEVAVDGETTTDTGGSTNTSNSDDTGSVTGPSGSQTTDSIVEGSDIKKSNTEQSNQNNEDQDNNNPNSDGSYYDKGGNLITPDSK